MQALPAERNLMFSVPGWSERAQTELRLYVPSVTVVLQGDADAGERRRPLTWMSGWKLGSVG